MAQGAREFFWIPPFLIRSRSTRGGGMRSFSSMREFGIRGGREEGRQGRAGWRVGEAREEVARGGPGVLYGRLCLSVPEYTVHLSLSLSFSCL